MKKSLAAIALATTLTGCGTTNLQHLTSKEQAHVEKIKDDVLEQHFIPEARTKLEKIPIQKGKTPYETNYASGRNTLIQLFDYIFLGLGYDRKTIINSTEPGKQTLLHEYIHHSSAIGLIDDAEFSNAWDKMKQDERFAHICEEINKTLDSKKYSFWLDLLLVWNDIEREAELAEKIVYEKTIIPSYVKRVYRKVLYNCQD